MLFTPEELGKEITLTVQEASVVLQLITRLNSECRKLNGAPAIADNELGVIGMTRDAFIGAVEKAIGKNYDGLIAAFAEAQQRAHQEAQAKTPPPPSPTSKRNKKNA